MCWQATSWSEHPPSTATASSKVCTACSLVSMMSLCAATSSSVFGLYFSTHGCESSPPRGALDWPAVPFAAMTPRAVRSGAQKAPDNLCEAFQVVIMHECALLACSSSSAFKLRSKFQLARWLFRRVFHSKGIRGNDVDYTEYQLTCAAPVRSGLQVGLVRIW